MSNQNYGAIFNTPYNPQKIIEKALEQAKEYVNKEIENIGSSANITVDQTYNPESENAQSGKAVAQILNEMGTEFGGALQTIAIAFEENYATKEFVNGLIGDIETLLGGI